MTSQNITLQAADGYSLAASLFKSISKSKHLVIVAPATGVSRKFYTKFAAYLAATGVFEVLTFDYRGIGESLHGHVRDNDSLMSDWGRYDIQAALVWGFSRYQKVFVLGHSVAGQVFPLAEWSSRVEAAYFVGSQCAASQLWDGPYRLFVNFFWHVANPVSTKIFGYMPAFVVGGGEHLPKNVALEWRSWGLHREGVLRNEEARASYKRLQLPVHFVHASDDRMLAPPRAVHRLKQQYLNANTSCQELVPKEWGLQEIGHFGFFKSRYGQKLWHLPAAYFRGFCE